MSLSPEPASSASDPGEVDVSAARGAVAPNASAWQAHFLGWLALALIHGVGIVRLGKGAGGALLGGWLAYELGHLLALALGGVSLIWGAQRLASLEQRARVPRWLGYLVVLALIASYLGSSSFWLVEDFEGFAARRAAAGSRLPWAGLGVLASGAGLAAVIAVARYLSTKRLAPGALPLGVGLALANNSLLPQSYPGLHALAAISAATFIGAGLRPYVARRKFEPSTALLRGVLVAAALGATCSIAILPGPQLWRRLFDLPGSPLVSFVARLHREAAQSTGPSWVAPAERAAWYQSRVAQPDVAPSALTRPVPQPIVVLVTIDALRAQVLAESRWSKKLPNLRRLAKRSLVFNNARSPSSATATSLFALETGKYYSGTRWQARNPERLKFGKSIWPSDDQTPRLGELLQAAGVHTVNVRTLKELSAASGMRRGYDAEIDAGHYASASTALTAVREQLSAAGPERRFIVTHLLEPHAPYRGDKAERSDWQRYLDEIRFVDGQLEALFALIHDTPRLRERTYVILAADHGEAFGEHGTRFHAATLYEELLRIPLLVSGPGISPGQCSAAVSLIDLGPTVLDLFKLPTPGTHLGQSLLPLLFGKTVALERPLAAEAARRLQSLVFADGIKAIVDLRKLTEEVYDLRRDPEERDNLAGTGPRARQAIADLRRFFEAHRLPDYEPPWRQF